ncbi:lipopolysaccharide heptosyltransferase II [bacterium]|nr:lipopolysaccharide heptosyltransferase II [bacterium]
MSTSDQTAVDRQASKGTGLHPPRILVFQTAFLGDLVLTLPLIDSIRSLYPDSFLAVVAIPSTRSLLDNHPTVDEVLVYDKRGGGRSLRGMIKMVRALRALKFSLAYTPHRSFRTALILALAGITERIGYQGTPGAFMYTKQVERSEDQHETARILALLGNVEKAVTKPRLPVQEPKRGAVQEWLANVGLEGKPFVAMAPGSVWATKRWPWIYWTKLAQQLYSEQGLPVVLVGGPDDKDLCGDIASKAGDGVVSAAGLLDVPGSAELLRLARLLITGDTAPLHLGVGVEIPVLAIFGPTVPEFGFAPTGPNDRVIGLDLDCRPCAIHGGEACPLGHHNCMRQLEPDQVMQAAVEMLDQTGAA